MTITECSTNLLFHFAPEERSVPDSVTYPGRNAAILEAMNGALQECFGNASPWVRWDERGAILKPPTAVTIAVTEGSTTATMITGWEAWMSGCSIVIDGHDVDNQIRNGSNPVKLKYPFSGTPGTVAAMVYQDAVPVGSDVMSVYGPVRVDGREILPRPSADIVSRHQEDYGAEIDFVDVPNVRQRVSADNGRPMTYWVETWSDSDTASPALRIRLGPANGQAGAIEYRVMEKPPALSSITSANTLPIPFEFDQTIFMPIARQKLTSSPFFRDRSGVEEIGRAYREALDLLKKMRPAKDSGVTLRPRF